MGICYAVFFNVRVHGCCRHLLGEILSLCETPRVFSLEHVTRASINIVVIRKRVKFRFGMNCPLRKKKKVIFFVLKISLYIGLCSNR